MLVLTLFACGGPATTDGTAPVPVPNRPEPAPAPAEEPEPARVPAASGEAFSEQWLVILSSDRTLGKQPASLDILDKNPDLKAAPVRLQSSQFKGLMPCYEIVIAKAFTDRAAAVDYSKKLTTLGIDNYPKNAGAYVGEVPKVEAFCATSRSMAETGCGDLRIVVENDGKAYAHIPLDEVAQERAMEGAPAPRAVSDTFWEAPLSAEQLSGHSVGDTLSQYSWGGEERGTCTIDGFSIVVRGAPHFGWYEGDKETPGCGTPEIFARLTCTEQGEVLGVKPEVSTATGETAFPALWESKLALATNQQIDAEYSDRTLHKNEQSWTYGDLQISEAYVSTSGEDALWQCGGDELTVKIRGATDAGGAVSFPFTDTFSDLAGVVRLNGTPHLVEKDFNGSISIMDATGAPVCGVTNDFCDCGC